eukprot:m.66393 g.66393  ORF g.66393 m.66393 type:complete len:66 (-) comp11803_c0_seq1:1016-1213(-)
MIKTLIHNLTIDFKDGCEISLMFSLLFDTPSLSSSNSLETLGNFNGKSLTKFDKSGSNTVMKIDT